MSTWIALLRGINVGGHHKVPMAALRERLTEAGLAQVRTLIQSGNVVFESRATRVDSLQERIATAIEESFGFRPGVFVIAPTELQRILDANPLRDPRTEAARMQLYFLEREPISPDLDAIGEAATSTESFALRGGVFYLAAPDGIGHSKLAAGVERWLGVAATARNQRTLRRVLELAGPA